MPAVRTYLDSPRLKMLAVLSAERLKELPTVPTMAERFPDFRAVELDGNFRSCRTSGRHPPEAQ